MGLGAYLYSCHSRVTFIFHRYAELSLCWSCAMCVLQAWGAEKNQDFPSPVWFPHTGSSECCLFCKVWECKTSWRDGVCGDRLCLRLDENQLSVRGVCTAPGLWCWPGSAPAPPFYSAGLPCGITSDHWLQCTSMTQEALPPKLTQSLL